MPVRFYLSPEDVRNYQADKWEAGHLDTLSDDWLNQQLVADASAGAPPAPVQPTPPSDTLTQPQPAPLPQLPSPELVAAPPPEPSPAQSPAMPASAPVLDLSRPAPVAPTAPLPSPSVAAATSPAPATGSPISVRGQDFTPNEFHDPTLSSTEAATACGPAAAVAFARAYGRNPTLREALDIAKQVGWTAGGGMNGVANQKRLLDAMNIPASLEGVDWSKAAAAASNGQPVTISTNVHYFTATNYDPEKGFYVGTSGMIWADPNKNSPWLTPQQIERLGGGANGMLYLGPGGSPVAGVPMPGGSAVAQSDQNFGTGAGTAVTSRAPVPISLPDSPAVSDRVRGNIDSISAASAKTSVPPAILAAIMDTEAGGPRSTSSAGATGFMQVLSSHFGPGEDPYDPLTNITRGAEILADNYRRYGAWDKAAAAYFGAIDSRGNITEASDASGVTGSGYVGRFLNHLSRYQSVGLSADTAPVDQVQTPGVSSAVQNAQNDQASQRVARPDETISNPFGEALRQVGDAVGGIASKVQLPTAGIQTVMGGQEAAGRGTEAFGRAAGDTIGEGTANAPTGLAIAEGAYNTDLRRQLAPNITEPNHPMNLMRDLEAKYAQPGDTLLDIGTLEDRMTPEDRSKYQGAVQAVAGMGEVSGLGGVKAISEITPPAASGSRVASAAGTAAEQAAVGAPEEGRAANILLSKFPEDVRPHLKDVADRFGQFAGQRRGVITDAQAEANAAEVALGTTPEKWIKTPAGKAFNQEQAIALGNTLTQVGKEYDGLLSTTRAAREAGTITPEMEANLADKTLELAALEGVRSGAAAEGGRTLRAFRQALGGGGYANRNKAIDAAFKAIGTDKEKFAQWVEQYATLDDPVAKHKMLQGLETPSWWDRTSLLRYASMLSATTTHLVNAFGNVINVGLDVALKPVSVGIDVARAGITGGERTRYMGELAPQVKGTLDGAVDGLDKALTTLRTGVSPSDLGKFENIRPGFQAGRGTSTILGAGAGGATGGLTAPADASPQERAARIAAGAAVGAGAGFGVGSTRGGLTAIDTTVEMPLRMLSAADSVFRGAAFGGNARAAAARKGIQEGLSGQALRARIEDIMTNLPNHPDIVQQADKAAARAVLQESNSLASAITGVGRGPGAQNTATRIVREIIVPFAKTPLNIVGQGVEMTPYGLLKARDLAKAGDVGGATDAAARVTFGSALMVGVGALAANGAVTGGYPADPKDRNTLPPGWQPWSVRLPNGEGGHNYVSFSQLGPVAVPMAIAAIAGQSIKEGVVADPITLATSLGKFMVDQTFLQGMSAIIDAIKDPKRYGENFTEQIATSFVPYAALSREVTRITGSADRDPKGAIEAIQALIPGAVENVPRRQDALGRDIHSTQTGIGAAVSPAKYSSTKAEPILNAFRDVGMGIPDAPKEIRISSQVTGSTSPPMALNEREQNEYQRLFGERLTQLRSTAVSSPDWNTRSLDYRKKSLETAVQAARTYAENQIYGKMTQEDRQKRMAEGRARQQVKPLPAP